jgi:HD-GYP domain-containing protein (c-di-GMP phosphodiesterase class II)
LRPVKAAASNIEAQSEEIVAAAMLHDYRKILWPPDLFWKRDLSLRDLKIISFHPIVGQRLVSERWPGCPETALRLIERHHNPGGWLPAQILAACDVWVTCRENRSYRCKAVSEKIVLQETLRVSPEKAVKLVLDTLKSNAMRSPF